MQSIKNYIQGILKSYSQVFFSQNMVFAVIIFIISFFDVYAGLYGLLATVTANSLSILVGYNKYLTGKGIYGFNALLAGLGMGLYYEPSVELALIVILVSVFIFFVTVVLQGVLYKYGLPFLSIPFLAGIWLFILSSSQFSSLGLSERGIYTANEIYAVGGHRLLELYEWFNNLSIPASLKAYFYSLGAIFFQYNLLSGILISIGLLIYSRISFSLSLIGFYTAYLFYNLTGADFEALNYNYIGFNYILTAIAIGGYYYIPRKISYFLVIIILPVVVLITLGLSSFFENFFLPVYSLPFNITVLFVLYALKLREKWTFTIHEPVVQHLSPEKNLYYSINQSSRFQTAKYFPISLPFLGEWFISQAHDGEYTHKNEWRHAWDFIIQGNDGKQYRDQGDFVKDYYCYGKNVVAPADGEVVQLIENIEDNEIGNVNIAQNWGNTIVIKHTEGLYSKICHLKNGSLKVKEGDKVVKGQIIAQVGNSGRSPYPHLHFQIQATPYIGSVTLDYPLQNYIKKENNDICLCELGKPELGQIISNPAINGMLKNALMFIPGKKLKYNVSVKGKDKKKYSGYEGIHEWNIDTDMYKNMFIRCIKSNSYSYFYNNGSMHYFTDFAGTKKSFLYLFTIALYKTSLSFYKNMELDDSLPVNFMFNKAFLFLQDFVAPFYLFLKSNYKIKQVKVDDEMYPTNILMESEINNLFFGKKTNILKSSVIFSNKGIEQLEFNIKETKILAKCIS